MVILTLSPENSGLPINPRKIKRRLGLALKALGRADSSLSARLGGDGEIRALNRDFRGVDRATNVLSFPWAAEGSGAPQGPREPFPRYLGDLFVSLETVLREARERETDPGYLLYFYLVHGLLHLLGFDHEKGPAEEARQDGETRRILALFPHGLD
ncbi:MAG: rRNA maturation RNase YbeY [Deltaproteobacteria bacterium]|jgi:probable rRNA maturation factor|nr:rRNA maturation RNase YbeY [Deltaproteobacteria bacterium]